MFYFSVKSKYINEGFFGTDYKKNLKHSNQVKTKQLVTGEFTISRKYLSPEKASVFEYCMMTPFCDEVYIVNFKIYSLLY